ncbi:MAG: LapA family protein [Pseudolabrys sp.]|nr:LapA family protein [Pseudolabrys sp.]
MTTEPARPSGWRIFGKALLGALTGFFLVPIIIFIIVLILNFFNAVCGTPGDSGGCEMGLATITIASALPGAVIGFVVNLVRGLRQRRG